MAYSTSNIGPADWTWVTCTDFDLLDTKVADPTPLVEALLDRPGLQPLRLPPLETPICPIADLPDTPQAS
ncbi:MULTISPECIES: hypothetical protein [unclassified Streptomyces]|uniref:hypothetical protein n=1 Tax=unclassified Streptomyces TaxID=2593676 RepID=UPI00037D808B|nr:MULTISPECIES: hypothetical protein [unclassified Streptomyces]MYT30126.1 hypothetical protein [Streptomyces sp. SID8354]